ncbi:MAG: hypothetical protein IPM14_05265 [bacterium]|nr:hypothetical protein [bacterium]
MKAKVKQLIENKRDELTYTGNIAGRIEKPVKITKVSDAKRLLSKLIYKLQTGEITGQEAKDLTYLLISYVNIVKEIEIENRLKSLEEKISNEE